MGVRVVLLALGLALLATNARAGYDLNTRVAEVKIVDAPGSACEHAVKPCMMRVENLTDPSRTLIDLRIKIAYLGVAPNASELRDLGVPVLDESVWFDPSSVAFQYDIFDRLGGLADHALAAHVYDGPAVNLRAPVGGSGDAIGRDEARPLELATRSGARLDSHDDNGLMVRRAVLCERWWSPAVCSPTLDRVQGPVANDTPRVLVAFEFGETQLATDPSDLHPSVRANASHDEALDAASLASAPPLPREERPSPVAVHASPAEPPFAPTAREERTPTMGAPAKLRPLSHEPPREPQPPLPGIVIGGAAIAVAAFLLLAIAAYSRIGSPRDALSDPHRERILEIIRTSLGIHEAELTKRAGMSRGSVRNHVAVLVRLGLVRRERGEARTALYPTDVRATHPPDVASYEHRRRILHALNGARDGLTLASLCAMLPDVPRSTLAHAVERLVALGSVRRADAPLTFAIVN